MRSQQVRECWAILGLIVVALSACAALAFAGDAPLSKSPLRVYECKRSHYTKFEDGSGKLSCNGREVVRVHVPH